jgi:hypothetical protein
VFVGLYVFRQPRQNRRVRAPELAGVRRVGPAFLYPPKETPGAIDPRVTDGNAHETICVPGYTTRVRPATRFIGMIKAERMREYGLVGEMSDYELDHIIPLELGGCPDCLENLWMEPYASLGAREKDRVENFLHREVCSDHLSLTAAQQRISRDWYQVYLQLENRN